MLIKKCFEKGIKLHLLYILALIFILSACSSVHKELQTLEMPQEEIIDLKVIPQFASFYSGGINKENLSTQDFTKNYFRVWNIDTISITLEEAMWAYNVFKYPQAYGENLQVLPQEFFDEVLLNSNFTEYATQNKPALSLGLLDIRAFPTERPVLRDPSKAGEGFPFDYMQNSTVAPNKPLFVSHYSKDKEWVFVESSFAFGWVKAKDIAYIPKKYTKLWQNAQQVFLTSEGASIYSKSGDFLFKSRVGMLLALISEDEQSYTVLTVSSDENAQAIYNHSKIFKKDGHKGKLSFDTKNINAIIQELMKTNYGWGGMYGQRDCSSTLRDFYMPFGLWLPRNSSMQSKQGSSISLEGLDDTQKIETIKKYAIPFETLLYKQGHIVLYVGTFDDEVVVFQNVWGVQTKIDGADGRHIVGKTVFSSLELGKNLKDYDADGSLLRNLKSLSFPAKVN